MHRPVVRLFVALPVVAALLLPWVATGQQTAAPASGHADSPLALKRPHVTSVQPSPIVGFNGWQTLFINGRGFTEGFTVRLKSKGVDAYINDRWRLDFLSSERVKVRAVFGAEALDWSVQVINPDSVVSNTYAFSVEAPVPQIEWMQPVKKMEDGRTFELRVHGPTVAAYSSLRWNGQPLDATPIKSSSSANALTVGLRAEIPAEDLRNAGQNMVTVHTPPPGGGTSLPKIVTVFERPFYWKPWFYLLFVVGLALTGLGIHWYRVKTVREKVLTRQVEARTRRLEKEKKKTEAQAAQLKELDEAKSRFLANLSHEFRTPLTMILGPVRDLQAGACGMVDEEARRELSVVERNARQMEHLIGQLLDLAQLESGRMKLECSRGDLARFVKDVVRSFASLAERRRVTLRCRAGDSPLVLPFDPEKLQVVVNNLLSNALKFTPKGGKVLVTVSEVGEEAAIRVRDTGPGIPPEELPHIFDRFHQVDGSATREHEGTGIGLSLARDLTRLHGGTIHAASEPGFGAELIVTLPKVQEEAREGEVEREHTNGEATGKADAPLETRSEKTAPTKPKRPEDSGAPDILIVEDNADVRAYLQDRLASTYCVREAQDGLGALDHIYDHRPDLVVSDIMMPEMDGIQLCRTLKEDERFSDIPVILLTAKAGEADEVEGLGVGADAYIEKPFEIDVLEAQIRNLIAGRQELRQRFSREVTMQPTGITVTREEEAFCKKARGVVEKHLGEPDFTVERFAQDMYVSKSTLGRKLKAATSLTPSTFIRQLRLERAAQLLGQDPMRRVSEVATAVGYRDADHFSKVFREHFGAAPSEYEAKDVRSSLPHRQKGR